MLMFRFWGTDSWGSEKTVESPSSTVDYAQSLHQGCASRDATTRPFAPQQPALKRRLSASSPDGSPDLVEPVKRVKLETGEPDASPLPCDPSRPASSDLARARDAIQHEFCTEILYKHNELRLIDQELAKCQAALEQLRRCHLIPYPVNCPTPEQMLAISSGKGRALQTVPGEPVPRWAPPFGVVDGPYSRHYSKWLIPDPSFDGVQPEWQFAPDAYRVRNAAEGRTTRNSFAEPTSAVKGRSGRGLGTQKLQALSSGYPQPKEKAGPCVLKRADGQTVKLVCLDCNRENFSSTQGFINHCRIAHKRDFKSHEEAAVHSGHPIDVAESAVGSAVGGSSTTVEEKSQSPPTPAGTTAVHPFARSDMTDQEAYAALRKRIAESLELYQQGKLPGVKSIPSTVSNEKSRVKHETASFCPAVETPHLSQLMKRRKFAGNLQDVVTEARTQVSLEDITPGEESEDLESSVPSLAASMKDAQAVRTPVVMRVPARTTKSPAPTDSSRTASNKGRAAHMSFASPPNSAMGLLPKQESNPILSDEDIDMEDANLSPHTLVSNNAPSLVSDDGEYDDSDEGCSVSGDSDNLEAGSVSDVAEISLDDDHEPRGLRRGSSGVSGAVSLRKDETKHVTFINPVKSSAKNSRPRKM